MKKVAIRKVLWYFIIALPLLIYLFSCLHNAVTFDDVMSNFVPADVTNVVKDTLSQIFQNVDIYNSLSDGVINYFVYFVGIEFVHLILDMLLFLPTLLHNAFDKFCGSSKGDM